MIRKRSLASLFLFCIMAAVSGQADSTPAAPATPPEKHAGWDFSQAGLIPLQSGGRLKPLDSFAREMMLFETGSRSFQGWDPVEMALSIVSNPDGWNQTPFIYVGREDVRRQLNLDDKRTRFSPQELYGNFALAQYATIGGDKQSSPPNVSQAKQKENEREQELHRLIERISVFHDLVAGRAWLLLPKPAPSAWEPLDAQSAASNPINAQFMAMLKAYIGHDQAGFESAAKTVKATIESQVSDWNGNAARHLKAEVFYNRAHPFQWAWIFYLLATLAWITSYFGLDVKKPTFRTRTLPLVLTYTALSFHVMGFGLRCYIAGRPPVTNMYESVVWVSFGIVIFASILFYVTKNRMALTVASAMATLGLILGDAAPAILDPSIRPLVPVLRSNYWLTVHVLTITLGYAAFALSCGIANVTLFQFTRTDSSNRSRIMSLNQLTYRAVQFGTVLLAAGTILGGIWADESWGRFWGWDPKEVWALIALLSYLAVLHARYAGYIRDFGFAAWTVAAFMSVLMAWYGVNFILGVGLHSYGFSSGGFTGVATFVSVQLGYVLAAYLIKRARMGGASAAATYPKPDAAHP